MMFLWLALILSMMVFISIIIVLAVDIILEKNQQATAWKYAIASGLLAVTSAYYVFGTK